MTNTIKVSDVSVEKQPKRITSVRLPQDQVFAGKSFLKVKKDGLASVKKMLKWN